jgi:serine/threonine-protein kinase
LRAGDPAYHARYTHEYRVQIINEILRGVQHAHEQGILHRDLKPANIMIGSLGEVVVMDWGLARSVNANGAADVARPNRPEAATATARMFETQAGALVGTPAYMSPEQASGQPLDERSDVYSLAVMFYEFLSLCHPRAECTSVAEMIASVCSEPISRAKLLREFTAAGAPAALSHFVRHGLDRDPERRYPSVAAMRGRLDAVRDGRMPIECHVTFVQRVLVTMSRVANNHPFLLLFAMLAVIAAGITGVVMLAR